MVCQDAAKDIMIARFTHVALHTKDWAGRIPIKVNSIIEVLIFCVAYQPMV